MPLLNGSVRGFRRHIILGQLGGEEDVDLIGRRYECMAHDQRIYAHIVEIGHHLALSTLDVLYGQEGGQGGIGAEVMLVHADLCVIMDSALCSGGQHVWTGGQADVICAHQRVVVLVPEMAADGERIAHRTAWGVQSDTGEGLRICVQIVFEPLRVAVFDLAREGQGLALDVEGQAIGHVAGGPVGAVRIAFVGLPERRVPRRIAAGLIPGQNRRVEAGLRGGPCDMRDRAEQVIAHQE